MRFQLTLTRNLIYLFLAIFFFNSCKKNFEEEKTFAENQSIERYITQKGWIYTQVNGIYHVARVPKYGYMPAIGDSVEFIYTGYTLDGKIFDTNDKVIAKREKLDTTIRSFKSLKLIAGESNLIDGLNYGLLQIRNGEEATILFPSALGYGGDAIGSVDAWSPLAYDIKLTKVNSPRIQEEISYIRGLNLLSDGFFEDASGLFYKIETLGIGLVPTTRDTIYGWYEGTLSNGTVFDQMSTPNKEIILSSTNIPIGLKLGFMLTKKTGITELVLPSYLGFGNNGNEMVKPYETIRYRIRLDSIKKK